jgi:hypothetical protein
MSTKQKLALITAALAALGAILVYLFMPPVSPVTTGSYVISGDNVVFSLLKTGGMDDDSVKAEIIQFVANGRLSVTDQDVTAVDWKGVTIQASTPCGELCYRFIFEDKEEQMSFSGVLDLAHTLVTGTYVRIISDGYEIVANVNMQVLKVY